MQLNYLKLVLINVASFSLFLELFRFHELGVRMAGA